MKKKWQSEQYIFIALFFSLASFITLFVLSPLAMYMSIQYKKKFPLLHRSQTILTFILSLIGTILLGLVLFLLALFILHYRPDFMTNIGLA